MTPTGELLKHMRRKPKQTSWRWAHNWTVPAASRDAFDLSMIASELSEIAAYIRAQYGVSVPRFDASS